MLNPGEHGKLFDRMADLKITTPGDKAGGVGLYVDVKKLLKMHKELGNLKPGDLLEILARESMATKESMMLIHK